MGTNKIDYITIDGPPGSNKEEIFSLIKRFMFKKRGYAGLKLMSDFEESDPLVLSPCFGVSKEDEQARRIRGCPNVRMVVLDHIAYVEARRINVARKIDYTSIRGPKRKLEIILMPTEEVCRETLYKNNKQQLSTTSIGFIYNGYKEYISNNERRLLVIDKDNLVPMRVMRIVWKNLVKNQ